MNNEEDFLVSYTFNNTEYSAQNDGQNSFKNLILPFFYVKKKYGLNDT